MTDKADSESRMIKVGMERGRKAFTFIPSAEASLADVHPPKLPGDPLDRVHALMLLTFRSGDCRPYYAEAAKIARQEQRRLSPLSSDWWRWRARARRYRRCAR